MAINDIPLLAREDILRRLAHLKGVHGRPNMHAITIRDLARWFGVQRRRIRLHTEGVESISDMWQVMYSQVFHLIDSGELELRVEVDSNDKRVRRKVLVRVPKPVTPPKRPVRPHVDLSDMTLGFT